jgi:hypothetical protein
VRFNEHGMRDSRAISIKKPAGVQRIAVLGDSFVEALQVEEEEGVCRRLEAIVDASTPCEVLNFGCSGFSSSLEYLQLREWVMTFEPDVVICLHHFSDFTEDWRFRPLAQREGAELAAIPASSSGWSRSVRGVLEISQAYRLGASAVDQQRRHRAPEPNASLRESFDAIVNQPYLKADQDAWTYSLQHVARMAELVRAKGARFLIVVIPIGPQVEPVDAAFAERVGYRYLGGGQRLEHTGYQQIVTDACDAPGNPCLDLLDSFRHANPDGVPKFYLPHDQHWTPAGHELAARMIAGRLRK